MPWLYLKRSRVCCIGRFEQSDSRQHRPRGGSSTNLGGIIRKSGSAVTTVHIQDVPRHPIALIRGKVERCISDGIDIAITMRWNAIE